eukprot:12984976-Alexandrium_andersonii.AAC.1
MGPGRRTTAPDCNDRNAHGLGLQAPDRRLGHNSVAGEGSPSTAGVAAAAASPAARTTRGV